MKHFESLPTTYSKGKLGEVPYKSIETSDWKIYARFWQEPINIIFALFLSHSTFSCFTFHHSTHLFSSSKGGNDYCEELVPQSFRNNQSNWKLVPLSSSQVKVQRDVGSHLIGALCPHRIWFLITNQMTEQQLGLLGFPNSQLRLIKLKRIIFSLVFLVQIYPNLTKPIPELFSTIIPMRCDILNTND